jgi:hypothetical protein
MARGVSAIAQMMMVLMVLSLVVSRDVTAYADNS